MTTAARVARAVAGSPTLWAILGSRLVRVGDLLRRSRLRATEQAEAALAASPALLERVVQAGPFRGMKYPAARSFGSTLYPKLVGCYECELHPWLQLLHGRAYTRVMDIGCAEGYYAVGLALLFPDAVVHAHDTDPQALAACREVAVANGVHERVRLGGALSTDDLIRFGAGGSGLIVCDCEGCELTLFTADAAARLADCDLIVELHDFLNPAISSTLLDRFRRTHVVRTVGTTPRSPDRIPVLRSLPPLARELAVAELRPGPMEWMLAESRSGGRAGR